MYMETDLDSVDYLEDAKRLENKVQSGSSVFIIEGIQSYGINALKAANKQFLKGYSGPNNGILNENGVCGNVEHGSDGNCGVSERNCHELDRNEENLKKNVGKIDCETLSEGYNNESVKQNGGFNNSGKVNFNGEGSNKKDRSIEPNDPCESESELSETFETNIDDVSDDENVNVYSNENVVLVDVHEEQIENGETKNGNVITHSGNSQDRAHITDNNVNILDSDCSTNMSANVVKSSDSLKSETFGSKGCLRDGECDMLLGEDTHGHTRLVIIAERANKPAVKYANVVDSSKSVRNYPSYAIQIGSTKIVKNTEKYPEELSHPDKSYGFDPLHICVKRESESENDPLDIMIKNESDASFTSDGEDETINQFTIIEDTDSIETNGAKHPTGKLNENKQNVDSLLAKSSKSKQNKDNISKVHSAGVVQAENCVANQAVELVNCQKTTVMDNKENVQTVTLNKNVKVGSEKTVTFKGQIMDGDQLDLPGRHKPLKRLALRSLTENKPPSHSQERKEENRNKTSSIGIKRFKMASMFGQKSKSEQNISLYKDEITEPVRSQSRDCIIDNADEDIIMSVGKSVTSESSQVSNDMFQINSDVIKDLLSEKERKYNVTELSGKTELNEDNKTVSKLQTVKNIPSVKLYNKDTAFVIVGTNNSIKSPVSINVNEQTKADCVQAEVHKALVHSAEVNEYEYEDTLEILEDVDISGSTDVTPCHSDDDDDSSHDSTSEGSFTLDDSPLPVQHASVSLPVKQSFFGQVQTQELAKVQVLSPVMEDVSEESSDDGKELSIKIATSSGPVINNTEKSQNVKTGEKSFEKANVHSSSIINSSPNIICGVKNKEVPAVISSRLREEKILQQICQQVDEKIKLNERLQNRGVDASNNYLSSRLSQGMISLESKENSRNDNSLPYPQNDLSLRSHTQKTPKGIFKEVILDNTRLIVEVSEDSAIEEDLKQNWTKVQTGSNEIQILNDSKVEPDADTLKQNSQKCETQTKHVDNIKDIDDLQLEQYIPVHTGSTSSLLSEEGKSQWKISVDKRTRTVSIDLDDNEDDDDDADSEKSGEIVIVKQKQSDVQTFSGKSTCVTKTTITTISRNVDKPGVLEQKPEPIENVKPIEQIQIKSNESGKPFEKLYIQTSGEILEPVEKTKLSPLEMKIKQINDKYSNMPKVFHYKSREDVNIDRSPSGEKTNENLLQDQNKMAEGTKNKLVSSNHNIKTDNKSNESIKSVELKNIKDNIDVLDAEYSKKLQEMSIEGDYQSIGQFHKKGSQNSSLDYKSNSRSSIPRDIHSSESVLTSERNFHNSNENTYAKVTGKKLSDYSPKYENRPSIKTQVSSYSNVKTSSSQSKLDRTSTSSYVSSNKHSTGNIDLDLLIEELTSANNHASKDKILGEFNLEDEVFQELGSCDKLGSVDSLKNKELQQEDFLNVINSCQKPLVTKSLSQLPFTERNNPHSKYSNKQSKYSSKSTSYFASSHRRSLTDLNAENEDQLCLTMELEDPHISYSQLTIGRRKGSSKTLSDDRTQNAMYRTLQKMRSHLGEPLEGQKKSHGSSDIIHHTPRFVRDTSKAWYKPHISRDEAIAFLKDQVPGSFVVRDSNSFPGAFGLALKVSQIPPNVPTKGGDPTTELVRHFLIEPTSKGVKLKGCSNEPVFGSLAALVYQHSITPLALPCKLLLPDPGEGVIEQVDGQTLTSSSLYAQGAACNVLFLYTADMESLTGPEAVAKAVKELLKNATNNKTTVVHFKVSSQGITLTDNKRRLFFRRHYAVNSVTYCGLDPEDRKWTQNNDETGLPLNARIFGFVARKSGGSLENQCHLFCELDSEQPASAIVHFITKVMIGQGRVLKS